MERDSMSGTSQIVTPLLVTPRQAAQMLSVCPRTLYGLTQAGEIPAVRHGGLLRYAVDDLRDFIKRAKCSGNTT